MKLHPNVINRIIYLATNYGGHTDEKKLLSHYKQMTLSPYLRENNTACLVDAKELLDERVKRNLPVGDVIPMKFNWGCLQKILQLYTMFSGYANEKKFRQHLEALDFTVYERTLTQEAILVLTEEYLKVIQAVGRKE